MSFRLSAVSDQLSAISIAIKTQEIKLNTER